MSELTLVGQLIKGVRNWTYEKLNALCAQVAYSVEEAVCDHECPCGRALELSLI